MTSFDLSKENEVTNLVNQTNNNSTNETSPNLLFDIKKLRVRNPKKLLLEILT